jgi:uncharacterized protein
MTRRAFNVLVKPTGPRCNLRCGYCFYLEKHGLYPEVRDFRMRDDVLEAFVRQYLAGVDLAEVGFIWQGGEPTLLGLEFFKNVLKFQREYADGRRITNSLQTNGTLLDDEWCGFLAKNRFLVGLSLDGPEELHDAYRVDAAGDPTFNKVMRGVSLLKKHGVDFNTLTVVNKKNSYHPREVYRFLKEAGSGFIQFIPLVEKQARDGGPPIKAFEGKLLTRDENAAPGHLTSDRVTDASVEAGQYGTFLIEVFDEWVKRDVGRVFVQLFDVALGIWAGYPSSLCLFTETCGAALALEHNGDLYSCDHYVYPQNKLGNILRQDLQDLASTSIQNRFGRAKSDSLPRMCRQCDVLFACRGECPKRRFLRTADGEDGLNYLCAAYKRFFRHIDGPMRIMAKLLREKRPPAEIMKMMTSA